MKLNKLSTVLIVSILATTLVRAPAHAAETEKSPSQQASNTSDDARDTENEAAEDVNIDSAEEVKAAFERTLETVPSLKAILDMSIAHTDDLTFNNSEGSTPSIAMALPSGETVTVPRTAEFPVVLGRRDGSAMSVQMPSSANIATLVDGSAIYEDVADDTDLIVQPQIDAGARMIVVIDGPDAPLNYKFDVDATGEEKVVAIPGGRAAVIGDEGEVLSIVEAAWAYDAEGNEVPAWYSIQGDSLVLNVEHNKATKYPVISDPAWTWGIVSGTAYFSRQETEDVAGGGLSVMVALVAIPDPFTAVLALEVGVIVGWASTALWWSNKCLKVQYGLTWSWRNGFVPGINPNHYITEAGIQCQ